MAKKVTIDELDELDLANAFGVHQAGNAGAFGADIDTSTAGTLGAAMTDAERIAVEYLEGKKDRVEAQEELKNVALDTFRVYVNKAADIALTVVAEYLKFRMPVLSRVIEAGKEFVKREVLGIVEEAAVKTYSWVKEKLFSW